MAQIKITKRTVDAAQAGAADHFLWDTELKGFGLKVTSRGTKSYIVQYRMGGRGSPTKRYTIGAHGAPWTPDRARQRAQELLIAVKSGRDPGELEREQRSTDVELAFNRYVDHFVENYAKRHQPRSWEQARGTLRFNAVPRFRAKPLPRIERREIAALLDDVARLRPATARYLHATLRKLFRWAVARGDLPFSPMAEMTAPAPPASRDRVLGDEELVEIWLRSHQLSFPFGPMVRLLIATGQRREEIGGMRWSEVDLGAGLWTIPADRAKNRVAHDVPLNELALVELNALREQQDGDGADEPESAELDRASDDRASRDLVFTTTGTTAPGGWSKAKARLDLLIEKHRSDPLADWRIHDIRRTFATGLQRLGIRFEVTEALLNHVSGSRAGVAGVYQRHNWAAEKRAALEAWGDALGRLISEPEAPLAKSAATVLQFERSVAR